MNGLWQVWNLKTAINVSTSLTADFQVLKSDWNFISLDLPLSFRLSPDLQNAMIGR